MAESFTDDLECSSQEEISEEVISLTDLANIRKRKTQSLSKATKRKKKDQPETVIHSEPSTSSSQDAVNKDATDELIQSGFKGLSRSEIGWNFHIKFFCYKIFF